MRHINEYIDYKVLNEGLLSWLKAFIKKLKGNQTKLIVDNGRVNMLDMDVKKLKYQKEPAKFRDLAKDKDTLEVWSNNKIGFPESFKIAKNINKYCVDLGEVKSDPYVYTFYYQSEATYYAGVLIYDNNVQYIENYLHIISIETNLVVDNPSEVQEAIFNEFKNIMNTKKMSIEGFTAKDDVHPKMKGIITKLGFKPSDDNPEIYKLEK